jgi:hypothetical protein
MFYAGLPPLITEILLDHSLSFSSFGKEFFHGHNNCPARATRIEQ